MKILVVWDDVDSGGHGDTKHDSDHWHGHLPLSYAAQYGCKALVKMLVLNVMQDDVKVDTKDRFRLAICLCLTPPDQQTQVDTNLNHNWTTGMVICHCLTLPNMGVRWW